jgi:hypothetical protein
VKVQAPAAVSSITGKRIRRPGETWGPSEDDDGSAAGDMMVPVVGIGAAYQHTGTGSSGHRWAQCLVLVSTFGLRNGEAEARVVLASALW